jgi:hypothetical protein
MYPTDMCLFILPFRVCVEHSPHLDSPRRTWTLSRLLLLIRLDVELGTLAHTPSLARTFIVSVAAGLSSGRDEM